MKSGPVLGTKLIMPISKTMTHEAKTRRRFRPTTSARAPDGTSARTMVAAHTALRMENWATVSPKSRNRMVKTG